MVTYEQLGEMYDAEVVDQDGHKVGGMCQVYLDNGTGSPAWVSVRTGWFGGRKVFCPVSNATIQRGRIQVPYPLAMIKDAPDIPCDGHLTEDEEEQLYDYYSVDEGPAPSG
ncbi:PRC-barrel domain-containing protein [Serinicoccus marinus]|uniref:PRC-barrel domain-containing protein n=1 Tax=Serinicoccus marinus TaxID=247333 RepID=UPI0003B48739|nr:PRC-barrel domain-containing protein [Serinicoccus marinus]